MQEIAVAKTQTPLQRVALGWILMLVGFIGLFLPVVPGAFLIAAGALMLNPQRTWLSRALEKCRMRFPALERAFRRFSTWDKCWQSRLSNTPGDSGSQFKV
jgi:Putative transmembrane protein (PGPGW)